MKRLTKRSNKTTHDNGICCTHFMGFECSEREAVCTDNCPWEEAVWSKLADYEDAEEQGLLLRLPCPIGKKVWTWEYPTVVKEDGSEWTVCDIRGAKLVSKEFNLFMLDRIGDLYFVTKEDAEKALAERQKAR